MAAGPTEARCSLSKFLRVGSVLKCAESDLLVRADTTPHRRLEVEGSAEEGKM